MNTDVRTSAYLLSASRERVAGGLAGWGAAEHAGSVSDLATADATDRWAVVRAWARPRDVGLVYGALVVVLGVTLSVVPASVADRFVLDSSTNLVNLRQHPPYVLVVSALVVPSVWQLWIVLPVVWAYGVLQRWLGRVAVVITVAFGHIGATLLVATVLTAGIAHDRFSLAQARAADVGVSYGLVAVLGLLTARLAARHVKRAAAAGTLVALGALVVDRSFTDLGHLAAWLIGLGLALLLRRGQRAGADQR
jgi:hypothetical protein